MIFELRSILFIPILLLAALAFLSGAEAAILAANRLRAKHRAQIGDKGAEAVNRLLAKKHDFLPVVLALETLLTVVITTLSTAFAQEFYPGARSLFVSALLTTLVVLLLGEILPKTIATHRSDRFAYFCAPVILFITTVFSKLFHPLTWILGHLLNLLGHDTPHAVPTETELKYLISLSREHGILQKDEEELLQNIFDFTDAKVGEIMVPRTQVQSIEADASGQEVLEKFAQTQKSRFPVQVKTLDHVIGLVDIRDILVALSKGENVADLQPFIKPAVFIPESKRVGQLLQEMRQEHFQLAILIDEYGGTAGLVTLTNLIEEIVGTLEKKAFHAEIKPVDEKNVIVPASAKIEEIEEKLAVKLNAENVQTIGGFVFNLFGRVPEQGEHIRYQNVKFTVTQKEGYRINQVMITKEGH